MAFLDIYNGRKRRLLALDTVIVEHTRSVDSNHVEVFKLQSTQKFQKGLFTTLIKGLTSKD